VNMQGKVALVTGAGGGIGSATALAFARQGAAVACLDVDAALGRGVADQIVSDGGRAHFVRCDVSSPDEVRTAIAETVEELGGLDYAHNNAGIECEVKPLHEFGETEWSRLVGINLSGVFSCMTAQLPVMLERGGGAIVNTASASGLVARPGGISPYVATKHGVIGLTKGAAVDYGATGIRVNAVCPGPIDTPFINQAPQEVKDLLLSLTPIKRFASPSEVAAAVVWLCSDEASFVTGTIMPVDGGVVAY
jgi:NAD(P)-dependent dehydrogenase (short-subunit alcohol dehydrogenase family)